MNKCERINTINSGNLMSQSASDGCNDSAQHPKQQQQQQSTSDSKLNASEIEKLYLRIKEDWL